MKNKVEKIVKEVEKIKVSKREIIEFKNLLTKYEKLTSKKQNLNDEYIRRFIAISKFYKDVGYEIIQVGEEYFFCPKSLFSKKNDIVIDYVDFDK